MTRIIAGTYGGRRLRVPAGDGTRPTTDRVREALFSSLQSEFAGLEGLSFLDMFAGSGAVGLEAVSRGAARVDLVESDRRAAGVIGTNIAELGVTSARVLGQTAERFVQSEPGTSYDVIFLDPPYAYAHEDLERLLVILGSWLAEGGVIVVERSKRDAFVWPTPLRGLRDRKYGETILWYGR